MISGLPVEKGNEVISCARFLVERYREEGAVGMLFALKMQADADTIGVNLCIAMCATELRTETKWRTAEERNASDALGAIAVQNAM